MFLRSIHYLRAVAALSVVIYHVQAPIAAEPLHVLVAGVDVFFVISGFVMVQICRADFSPGLFLLRRAVRIYPVYWAACVITMLLLPVGQWDMSVVRDFLLFPEQTAVNGFIYFDPFLWQGWTLSYEVIFYLLFAICLGRTKLVFLALLLLAGMSAVWPSAWTNPIILEFGFGMAIAAANREMVERLAVPALVAGICGLLLAYDLPTTRFPERVIVLGIPAALIVLGMVGLERRLPHVPAIHFLGSASYSIYLFHYVGIYALYWSPMLTFAAAVAAGCVAHVLIERPMLSMLAPLWRRTGADHGALREPRRLAADIPPLAAMVRERDRSEGAVQGMPGSAPQIPSGIQPEEERVGLSGGSRASRVWPAE